jgi:putative endonuclease
VTPVSASAPARGAWAEQAALDFLTARGLQALARNFRCVHGEIDLVLREGAALVLAEVRYRSRGDFGTALESVTATKRQRVMRTAQHFLLRHPELRRLACRFDVLGVTGPQGSPAIEWIKDAFRA